LVNPDPVEVHVANHAEKVSLRVKGPLELSYCACLFEEIAAFMEDIFFAIVEPEADEAFVAEDKRILS
jgi:hypothetical protein